MLHSRVRLILDYVKAVQAGEVPHNHEVLREAYSLSHRLPVLNSEKFSEDFYNVSYQLKEYFEKQDSMKWTYTILTFHV